MCYDQCSNCLHKKVGELSNHTSIKQLLRNSIETNKVIMNLLDKQSIGYAELQLQVTESELFLHFLDRIQDEQSCR